MNDTTPMSPVRSTPWVRVGAVLSTNLFSVRGLIRRLRGQRELWPDIVAGAALPDAVSGAIVEIVRRTRLWNDEQIDVARELCNHAAEALAAGRDADDIARSLGTPKTVARLIRRSTKRKRPLAWQIRAWAGRGLGVAAGGTLLFGGGMGVRFFVGSPTIERNFVAELNEPIEKLAEDEKAWPLLQEAWGTLAPKHDVAERAMEKRASAYHLEMEGEDGYVESFADAGTHLIPHLPEGHPDTEGVMAVYRDIQGELEIMREAAARPRLGMPYSTKFPELPEELYNTPEARGWLPDPIPESDDPAEQDWIVGVMLPALGPQRITSKWLGFDAHVKLAEGDADGALASIEAMMGIADQCAEDHFLIGYLVGIAIEHLAMQVVSDMLTDHRDALGDGDLVRLAHLFGTPRFERVPFEGEEMMFQDYLQRAFTDDGNGDGHFTDEGLKLLGWVDSFGNSIGKNGEIVNTIENIRDFALIASRAEQWRAAERIYAQLRAEEAAGYGVYRDTPLASETLIEALDEVRYRPVRTVLPAVSRVLTMKLERRARVDACLVAVAAELYRRQTGAWPASAGDLSPRYLPSVPEDPMTGKPIAIAPGERTVTVYAFGPDWDDDGGVMDPDEEHSMRPRPRTALLEEPVGRLLMSPMLPISEHTPDGDWVLFPATTGR